MGLLEKFFIKEDMSEEKKRSLLGILCGMLGIFLNILLFAGKYAAGLISHSIAITADAFNNLSDAGSSIITLLGFRLASRRPDPDHPYGHGRVEYISGFIVALLILVMAFELIKTSVGKIIAPEPTNNSLLTFAILACSILVKLYMSYYNRKTGDRINSASLRATATDSLSDCISTAVVLVTGILSKIGFSAIDGWAGLAVGLFILRAGYSAAKETLDPLLGQPPEEEFVDSIRDMAMNFDENIVGIHDLMVHDYGPARRFITFHAEVPAEGDVTVLHDIIDNLEEAMNEKLGCLTTIHMDPIATTDRTVNEAKAAVRGIVSSIDPSLNMHDFRMVKGTTHSNLVFDVVVPYGFRMKNSELSDLIRRQIVEKVDPSYKTVIHFDNKYV